MESNTCYSGFELISGELGLTVNELIDRIRLHPKETSDLIKKQALSEIPLILGEDLTLRGSEAAFISRGSDLREYLENYFQRIHNEAEFLGEPRIESTEEVNVYLQEKIGRQLHGITDKLLASSKFGCIYESFEKLKDLKHIAQQFSTLVSKYLNNTSLISGFISALASDSGKGLVEESAAAAFVAMAVLHHYRGADVGPVDPQRLVDLGISVVFQDIAHILENSQHDPNQTAHARESADIALDMGLSETIRQTIRHHHRVTDTEGNPILDGSSPPLEERITVTTNAFMQCVSQKHFGLNPDQAIYVLEHYANRKFYDEHCVRTLGTIGIGDRKYKILSQSFQFAKHCPKGYKPFIWDISQDFPNRFICRHMGCEHMSSEEVVLYQSIRFRSTVQNLDIPKGRYHKCEKITRQFNHWLLDAFFTGREE